MSVAAPSVTTSPAPANPFVGRDLSDPKVRADIYDRLNSRSGSTVAPVSMKMGTICNCCGAAGFENGLRTYPFGQDEFDGGKPVVPNDGTLQSIVEAMNAKYTSEWFQNYEKNAARQGYKNYYHPYDMRTLGSQKKKEEVFENQARQWEVKKFNIIYSSGITAEEGINKWFSERKENVKFLEFNDSVDGKGCLMWVEE